MTDAEKTKLAADLDTHVRTLRQAGIDGIDLFAAMFDHMPAFQRLTDAAAPGELDRLAACFSNLRDYAVLLTSIAAAIRDGTIEVPR